MDKLNTFHNMCARYISGRHIRLENKTWVYPNTEITLKQANLLTIDKDIEKRKKKVENYVHTLQICDECKNFKANCQTGRKLVWWSPIGEIDDYGS
jgi:hypothetical protein